MCESSLMIDREIVEKTARVAHISLTEEERARYERDLSDLLDCFNVLDGAPETGGLCMNPVEVADITREDTARIEIDPYDLLREMDTYDNYIRGPRLS